jgi:hypothetical protein
MAAGAEDARAVVERFLADSREPAVLEPGEEPLPLQPGAFSLEVRAGRLTLQAWDATRNFARRISGLGEAQPGKLELRVERLGKRQGQLFLIDLARGRPSEIRRRGTRLVFREQFRRFLSRQFPGWKIAELSTEANLQESLSPVYPRALLRKGDSRRAALACPAEAGAAAGALTFALVWLDHLRRRQPRLAVEELVLYLPEGHTRPTCLRLPFLDPRAARFTAFVYSEQGYEECLDPRDYGNLDTRLEPCRAFPLEKPPQLAAWLERLGRRPEVETVSRRDGGVSFRVRGLEFARAAETGLVFGLDRRAAASPANFGEIERLAAELARLRSPDAADRDHPLYRLHPEAWLESQARASLERLDPSLLPAPVYGQVPAVAGGERGVIDLLAAGRDGRLAVLELKASEDIHFPLQALDYWMRVNWHLERGEFTGRGYFPGLALRAEAPRLLLVAPALDFHPKSEVVLRYFPPGIEVERVGLGADWRQEVKVVFRLRGAEHPVR